MLDSLKKELADLEAINTRFSVQTAPISYAKELLEQCERILMLIDMAWSALEHCLQMGNFGSQQEMPCGKAPLFRKNIHMTSLFLEGEVSRCNKIMAHELLEASRRIREKDPEESMKLEQMAYICKPTPCSNIPTKEHSS